MDFKAEYTAFAVTAQTNEHKSGFISDLIILGINFFAAIIHITVATS